jgi:hypothetical protein
MSTVGEVKAKFPFSGICVPVAEIALDLAFSLTKKRDDPGNFGRLDG